MKPLCLIFLLFLLTLPNDVVQASESSTINNFLQCFSRYSNPSYPTLSSALYSRKNTAGFASSLEFYIGNQFRFGNSSSSSSSAWKPARKSGVITALDVNFVQATIVCARASGLNLNAAKGLKFDGLLYASDVPLVILDV